MGRGDKKIYLARLCHGSVCSVCRLARRRCIRIATHFLGRRLRPALLCPRWKRPLMLRVCGRRRVVRCASRRRLAKRVQPPGKRPAPRRPRRPRRPAKAAAESKPLGTTSNTSRTWTRRYRSAPAVRRGHCRVHVVPKAKSLDMFMREGLWAMARSKAGHDGAGAGESAAR